ncbi:hypothetical protein COOONC_08488 [Cooperia oncophora]
MNSQNEAKNSAQTSKGKCQPIEIPLCKEVPYNYTYFPNPYLQQDQQSQREILGWDNLSIGLNL